MISYIMNTKNCMSVLLLSDRFDSFSFIGGEITTYCTFQIDGTYHPEFFADKEDAGSEPYVRWSYVREYCLIIGQHWLSVALIIADMASTST